MDIKTERQLTALIVPDSGVEFTGDVWRSLRKPCIYVMSSANAVLYVGMSANGLTRPFSPRHKGVKSEGEVETVKVYQCRSVTAARRVERALIVGLKPKWNHRQTIDIIATYQPKPSASWT